MSDQQRKEDSPTSGLRLKYFVLKPQGSSTHARASRKALLAYAKVIEQENATLAKDLYAWERREAAASIA